MNIRNNVPLNRGIHNNDDGVIGEIIVIAKAFQQAQVCCTVTVL
jgi:hypothetical protein